MIVRGAWGSTALMDVAMIDRETAVVTWSEQTVAVAKLCARRVPRNGKAGPSTTDGKDLTIQTSSNTKWLHADSHEAKKSDLEVGQRVVVKMTVDGKTADTVKMSATEK